MLSTLPELIGESGDPNPYIVIMFKVWLVGGSGQAALGGGGSTTCRAVSLAIRVAIESTDAATAAGVAY